MIHPSQQSPARTAPLAADGLRQMIIAPLRGGDDTGPQAECKFVEVLTAHLSGNTIGYRFGGDRPGPNALVTGDARLMDALFDRLHSLPTLPWMRGQLSLVTLDSVDCADPSDVERCMPDMNFDAVIMLPYATGAQTHDYCVDRAYWTSLRLCRQLGMISGRGVPDRPSVATLRP